MIVTSIILDLQLFVNAYFAYS